MPAIRQVSFGSGELAPSYWGRTDLPVYAHGLRRMRNFFADRAGNAVSRPGTTFVVEGLGGFYGASRLIPFMLDGQESVVLEFSHERTRVIRAGQVMPGVLVSTPYAQADLWELQVAQQGDVLTICHPAYPPAELRRDGVNWSFASIDFTRPTSGFGALILPLIGVGMIDSAHPPREWDWVMTMVTRDNRGIVTESAPTKVNQTYGRPIPWSNVTIYGQGAVVTRNVGGTNWWRSLQDINQGHTPESEASWWVEIPDPGPTFPLYVDRPVRIGVTGSLPPGIGTLIGFRFYRGRGNVYGWVGDVDWTVEQVFVDRGDEPDFATAPPNGTNPFVSLEDDGVTPRTEYPAAVTYFEQRRVFGGTRQRGGFLFASCTADYSNFDERLVPTADDALLFELASRGREGIRSLLGKEKLLAFTDASVWSIGGSRGEPLTFFSIDAKAQLEVGSAPLAPLVVGETVIFPKAAGGARALAYDYQREGYGSADLSDVAKHFVEGVRLVDWCYAEEPHGVVWAVTSGGVLLSLSYVGERWGWARHDVGGTVHSVCAVREGGVDVVYLVVMRGIERYYVERLAPRRVGVLLDSSKDFYLPPSESVITGMQHLAGKQVMTWVKSRGTLGGPYLVDPAGNIDLGGPWIHFGTDYTIGLPFTAELETLDAALGSDGRGRQKLVREVLFEVSADRTEYEGMFDPTQVPSGVWAGQDFGHLVEWLSLDADGDVVDGRYEGLIRVPVDSAWNTRGRAVLRLTGPFPLTVYGLTREVDVGG